MSTLTPKLSLPRPTATDNANLTNQQALIDAIDNHTHPADITKANVNNPTITGTGLTLPADPINALHAATKQYVDAQVAIAKNYAP
jgi:hypothetical protein